MNMELPGESLWEDKLETDCSFKVEKSLVVGLRWLSW